MRRRGRPMAALTLTDEESDTLERWTRRPTTAQALAQRARMILLCARGASNGTVAGRLQVTRQTVGRWRARFIADRLEGLLDEPRPGSATEDQRRGCRTCDHADPGEHAAGRDALEY